MKKPLEIVPDDPVYRSQIEDLPSEWADEDRIIAGREPDESESEDDPSGQ